MWKWRDMFLGVNFTERDTKRGLELARTSSLPEAQWLCRLFPNDGDMCDQTIIDTLVADHSAAGYYYAYHRISGLNNNCMRARELGYPLANIVVKFSDVCEKYEWAYHYNAYSLTFTEIDPRRYLWKCKLLLYKTQQTKWSTLNALKTMKHVPAIIYTIGRFISTEELHDANRSILKKRASLEAIELVSNTHEIAVKSIILWILWAKRQINLVNRDVRKMIAMEIWKDRIKFADLV